MGLEYPGGGVVRFVTFRLVWGHCHDGADGYHYDCDYYKGWGSQEASSARGNNEYYRYYELHVYQFGILRCGGGGGCCFHNSNQQ